MGQNLVDHWQNIYQAKDTTKVGWHQERPQISLDFIAKSKVSPEDPIIDVGGGDSRLVDHLLEIGFQNLWILDISAKALNKVKHRLAQKQGQVTYSVSDVLDFHPKTKFGLWHDRAVFHFLMDKKEQQAYRSLVEGIIAPGGYMVLATFSRSGPNMCSGLPVKQYSIEDLEEFFSHEFSLMEGINYDHITPAGIPQNYTVCLFQRI
ncbi:MAG: class I SAM-dependent methyltransferase [Algoriphagus sp.]|uniref:class I SAM-dependent methyltransferase n=1 Tax=Algoriphagus sp. TaxID=1872435 RepID=UPI002730F5D0|nr:class I SAM-dependent methyltransferase [Algoriphagus sp.]MDP2041296.1 class I SAM-dependent methyltransferase [Algoriphagus sp.]MDP3472473.1 class I SAM-dependent methyltransferase [Algoriphagus sp.]